MEDVNTPVRWELCHSKIVAVSELAIAEISQKLATKKFAPAEQCEICAKRLAPPGNKKICPGLPDGRKSAPLRHSVRSQLRSRVALCAYPDTSITGPYSAIAHQRRPNRHAPEAVPLPVVSARSCPPLSSQPQPKLDDPKWTEMDRKFIGPG